MILHYFGITEDSPDDMMIKVFEQYFTEWTKEADNEKTAKGASRLTLSGNIKEVVCKLYELPESQIKTDTLNLTQIQNYIAEGYPVWFSWGPLKYLTETDKKTGHISVIRGFSEDGNVIINDPWGDPTNTAGGFHTGENDLPGYSQKTGYVWGAGAGSGDNVVVKSKELERISLTPFNQNLVIVRPKIWSFPFKTDYLTPLKPDETEEMRDTEVTGLCFDRENWKGIQAGMPYVKQGFPVSGNGSWHDGIHIRGSEGESVYPIGPGRIVAVRNTVNNKDKDSYNFILLKHTVPGQTTRKSFYSLYMHLAPIDIVKRVSDKFAFDIEQKESRDWIDQMADYLMPKKAMLVLNGKEELDGNDANSMPVYKMPGGREKTDVTLKDRSIVYLCPKNEDDKKLLTDLKSDNEEKINQLVKKLDDISTYTRKTGNTEWLRIFTKVKKEAGDSYDGEYSWKDGYIEYDRSKIYVQTINVREYRYYRQKIKKIADGETVTFTEKETDIKIKPLTWQEVLREKMISIFPIQMTDGTVTGQSVMFEAVQQYYTGRFNKANTLQPGSFFLRDLIWNDFENRCIALAADLLTYPEEQVNDPFITKKKCFTVYMKNTYKALYDVKNGKDTKSPFQMFPAGKKNAAAINAEENEKKKEKCWTDLYNQFSIYKHKNTDYYIEADTNSAVGCFGKYDRQYQVHVEIFSDSDIIGTAQSSTGTYYKIVQQDKSSYYDKPKTAEVLLNAGIENIDSQENMAHLSKKKIVLKELSDFYEGNQDKIRHLYAAHYNNLYVLTQDEFSSMVDGTAGTTDSKKENRDKNNFLQKTAFLDDEIRKKLGLEDTDKNAWFYHPVQFVLWLNQQQKKASEKSI